jgi:hypothetical protein
LAQQLAQRASSKWFALMRTFRNEQRQNYGAIPFNRYERNMDYARFTTI